MNKVIVMGGLHGGLSAIRSLGRRGLYVIAVTHNRNDFGTISKYVKERAWCPDPTDYEAIFNYLMDNRLKWEGNLILETSDYYSIALSRYKDELSKYYRIVTPDKHCVETFINKDKTYELADQCGVPHPKIFYPTSISELDIISSQITFPIMIKPIQSHKFGEIFKRKHFICENQIQLDHDFRRVLDANQPVMIQEIIPGTDEGTLERVDVYINSKGEISCQLFSVKLRQTPPLYGIMRVGKTITENKEAEMLSLKLLKQINYKGFANIEFKRDPRDGKLKLIEVNVRLSASTHLVIAAGGDIPWIIYQDMVEDNQMMCEAIESGVVALDIIADIRDFLIRDKGHYRNYIQTYMAKRKTFFLLSLSDPMPFVKRAVLLPINAMRKLL